MSIFAINGHGPIFHEKWRIWRILVGGIRQFEFF
jgi:hypothetical protein